MDWKIKPIHVSIQIYVYILDYTNKKEQVEDVLSNEQLQTLNEATIKSFVLEDIYIVK